MKIIRFEDIEAWKEARKLVNMIYDLTNEDLFKRDFGLREQIQRAAKHANSQTGKPGG